MPRIQRRDLPRDLWAHLLERIKKRHISVDQLELLADWLATEPECVFVVSRLVKAKRVQKLP